MIRAFVAANVLLQYTLEMPSTTRFLYLYLALISLFLFSCVVQSPPPLQNTIERSKEDLSREGSCINVRLDSDLLEQNNLLLFFQCTTWNSKFPALYTALNKIEAREWDHLFRPIDASFYSSRPRREKFFQEIKKLDRNHGLDELAPVLADLFGKSSPHGENIIHVMNSLLVGPNSIDRNDITKLITLMNSEPASVQELLDLAIELTSSFAPQEADFKESLSGVVLGANSIEFNNQRKLLVDELANAVLSAAPSYEEKVLLPRLIAKADASGKNPWIFEWLQSSEIDYDKFSNLVSFPFLRAPGLSNDLRTLTSYFDQGLACKARGKSGQISLNLKKQFLDYSLKMAQLSQEDFMEYSLGTMSQIVQSESACELGTSLSRPENGNSKVNIFSLMKNLSGFLEEEKYFELANFGAAVVSFNNGPSDPGSPLYLIQILKSGVFERLTNLNEILIQKNKNPITKPLFPFVKSLRPLTYLRLAKLMKKYSETENYESFKVLAKIWLKLNDKQKDFLLGLADTFIKHPINLTQQIQFLLSISAELPLQLEEVASSLSKTEEQRNKTYEALVGIFAELDTPEVRDDLEKFFSRDHVLRLVEILSSSSTPSVHENVPYFNYQEDFLEQLEMGGVHLVPVSPDARDRVKQLSACLTSLSERGSLEGALESMPDNCKKIDSSNFAFNTLLWLNEVQEKYLKYTGGTVNIFDANGLSSRAALHEGLTNLKVLETTIAALDQSGGDENKGVVYLLQTIKKHLLELDIPQKNGKVQNGLLATIESALRLFVNLVKEFSHDEKKLFDGVLLELAGFPEKELRDYTKQLGLVLKNYADFKFENKTYVQKETCAQAFQIPNISDPKLYGYGVNPCPDRKFIKDTVRSILLRAKAIHENEAGEENSPPFLENFLALIHPDGGIKIPFEAEKQTNYTLSLKTLLLFSWDMVANNEPLEFAHEKGSFTSKMDRASQLEVVIRDIGFTNNYYGIIFQNETARALDYADATRHSDLSWNNFTYLYKRTEMLATNPMLAQRMRNNGLIPKSTEWQLKNVLKTFRGLHYVADFYEHKGKTSTGVSYDLSTSYKDLMQSFLTLQVMSSSIKSRNYYGMSTSMDSPNDELGLKHNSLLMVEAMNLSTIRNISRFLKDRISRDENEYFDFLNSYNFNRVDQKLLKKINLEHLQKTIRALVEENTKLESRNLFLASDAIIDWLYDSSYNDLRHYENLLANLSLIGSYLGEDSEFPEFAAQNKGINLNDLIENLSPLLKAFPNLKQNWPKDVELKNILSVVERQTAFLAQGLSPEESSLDQEAIKANCTELDKLCRKRLIQERRKVYYAFLNTSFKLLNSTLLKKPAGQAQSALALVTEKINQKADHWVAQISTQVDSFYRYVLRLHQVKAGDAQDNMFRFTELAQNLYAVANHPSFSLGSFQTYLKTVAQEFIGTGPGLRNPHFRELETLAGFLVEKGQGSDQSNLELGARFMLVKQYDSVKNFIHDTLSLVEFNSSPLVPYAPNSRR